MIFLYIILLLVVVTILGADASCRLILEKVILEYGSQFKCRIPGYNIYRYLKWKKELK